VGCGRGASKVGFAFLWHGSILRVSSCLMGLVRRFASYACLCAWVSVVVVFRGFGLCGCGVQVRGAFPGCCVFC